LRANIATTARAIESDASRRLYSRLIEGASGDSIFLIEREFDLDDHDGSRHDLSVYLYLSLHAL